MLAKIFGSLLSFEQELRKLTGKGAKYGILVTRVSLLGYSVDGISSLCYM